jgi:SAM-dependent methyltransferase
LKYLDILARLGVGNAHPGGFAATLEQLRHYPIAAGSKVLEIGCGTGRTACHLAKQDIHVTAVDIHQDMLMKAKKRAAAEQVAVSFVQADACSLPFADNEYDVVWIESVSIFTDPAKVAAESYRVLKSGGMLYDREMVAVKPITDEIRQILADFYGIKKLLSPEEWLELLNNCRFQRAKIWKPGIFTVTMWENEFLYPDEYQWTDMEAYTDPQVWKTMSEYENIMEKYGQHFGFGVLIGAK